MENNSDIILENLMTEFSLSIEETHDVRNRLSINKA